MSFRNREVKHHLYGKRQTRICTTWPSFPLTCCLLLILSTDKLVVSHNFLSIRIVLSCFYVPIFYFEKFSTWIWRLPFAVYVKLNLSNVFARKRCQMPCVFKTWPCILLIYLFLFRRLQRDCTEACTIKGVQFPKGLPLLVPCYAIHHDPEIYPEPEKFDPER